MRTGAVVRPTGSAGANQAAHTEAVVANALPVLKASGGRAFLLFTSLARARSRARPAARRVRARKLDYPILVQGSGSRTELLDRFRFLGNAVLLGSQSFWEGVDVRGEALSVVVIDKLPFAPPDDPVLQARLEHMAKQGGNPFFDYQVPQAAISLKQGAGRLIRSETDRGRADDLRHAPRRQALRPQALAQPAADEAHARTRRGRCFFQ
jgi:ATP-dependent DNA helicase DinG